MRYYQRKSDESNTLYLCSTINHMQVAMKVLIRISYRCRSFNNRFEPICVCFQGIVKQMTNLRYVHVVLVCIMSINHEMEVLWMFIFISNNIHLNANTIESRYLELGYLEFCEVEASVWIKNTFWLLFSTISWRRRLSYKSKLPEVQINLHFG